MPLQREGSFWKRKRRESISSDEETRNVEDEIAKNLWQQQRMLSPASTFLKRFDKLLIFLVTYNCFVIPLVVGFNLYGPPYYSEGVYHPALMALDYLVDVIFIADIVINFQTTFYNEEGVLVVDKREVRKRYLYGKKFRWDLLGVLPWEIFGLFRPCGCLMQSLRLFRLIRVHKHLAKVDVKNSSVRVAQLLSIFLVVSHIVGTIWWAIGVDENNRDADGLPPGRTWVERAQLCDCSRGGCVGPPPSPPPLGGGEADGHDYYCRGFHIDADGNEALEDHVGLKLLTAEYWAIMTLIKTPYILPDTVIEKVYVIAVVLCGAVLFAFILGNITAMMNAFDKANAQLRDSKAVLARIMNNANIPPSLQKRAFTYVQTTWTITKGLDTGRVTSKLPVSLRGDILEAVYIDMLESSPVLSKMSQEMARVLLTKLHVEICLAQETLISPGARSNTLYFLAQGLMRIDSSSAGDTRRVNGSCSYAEGEANGQQSMRRSKSAKMNFKLIEKPGAVFGLCDVFERDRSFPYHVFAVKQSQLYGLSLADISDAFSSIDARADVDRFCEVVEREFDDLVGIMSKGQEKKPEKARRKSAENRWQSIDNLKAGVAEVNLSDQVLKIEETLLKCQKEMRNMTKDLSAIPQIVQLLGLPPDAVGENAIGPVTPRSVGDDLATETLKGQSPSA